MEIPTESRGAVQLDAIVHLIGSSETSPIKSPAGLSLLAAWAYRF